MSNLTLKIVLSSTSLVRLRNKLKAVLGTSGWMLYTECFLALKREVREELGITDFIPETVMHYVFESAREKELVFVHKTVYDGEIHPSDELDGGRFWSPDEIKANIGKGVFTPNFEGEIGKVINL